MIHVTFREQGDRFWLEVTGHAEPIVCAAVSGLLQAYAQRVEDTSSKTVTLHKGENHIHGTSIAEMESALFVVAGIRRMRDAGAPIELIEEHD